MFRKVISRRRPISARKSRCRLSIERLEDRRCLSIDVQLLNNLNQTNPWGKFVEMASAGDYVYFVANETSAFNSNDTKASELDLWRTDGTTEGTLRLASVGPENQLLSGLTNVNGTLYFRGYDSEHGFELWKSDGTVAGTKLVRDQSLGPANSKLDEFVALGNQLLFTKNGNLMRSNGNQSGTVQVADFLPNAVDNVSQLAKVGNSIYFKAKTSSSDFNLYKTDGTSEGTVPLQLSSGQFDHLTKVGNSLYFTRKFGDHTELWRTNGETNAVQMVDSTFPGYAYGFTDVSGTMYYSYGGGIGRVESNNGVDVAVVGDIAFNLFNMNGTLYFSGGTEFQGTGFELWKSDGTQSGTVMVKDIDPGFFEGYGFSSNPSAFTNLNGTLYFLASGGVWKTDGTTEGTIEVESKTTRLLIEHQDSLYFSKQLVGTPYFGLSKRDVSKVASEPIPRKGIGGGDADPSTMVELNGAYYFGANDGIVGSELWKYDATSKQTTLVKDITPGLGGSNVQTLASINGKVYFTIQGRSNGNELWASDGTEAGTSFLGAVRADKALEDPAFIAIGSNLFFRGYDPTGGFELWKTDGTTSGTMMVKDTFPGSTYLGVGQGFSVNSGFPSNFTQFNNTLYFSTYSPDTGRELWKSDGTVQGTILVDDLYTGGYYYYGTYTREFRPYSSDPRGVASLKGRLHFVANDQRGTALWRSDGTSDGTRAYRRIGLTGSNIARVNNELYFSQLERSGNSQSESLWKTDGSAAGTIKVKDIRSGPIAQSSLKSLTNMGGILYFVGNDGIHGNELWRSDGTANGTAMIRDIRAGQYPTTNLPRGSEPKNLIFSNGVVFFTADDGVNGRELWRTNGTADGVTLVSDILPGKVGSGPANFSLLDGKLYFSARALTGREVWVASSVSPQIRQVPEAVNYIQASPALRLAANAVVTDPDTPSFSGGRLTVRFTSTYIEGDRLLFSENQDIRIEANVVFYSASVIGKLFPNGGRSLTVDLNLNATPQAITELVQAIAFKSDLPLPLLQSRQLSIQVTDGEGAVSRANSVEVIVRKANVAPALNQIGTILEYTLDGPPILIAPIARVVDVDNDNFLGGGLTITVNSQGNANAISIVGSEFVFDANRNLLYRGAVIGKEVARTDVIGLKFEFNEQATGVIVQRLLRSIAFSTVGSAFRVPRTLKIVLSDGMGGSDNAAIRVDVV